MDPNKLASLRALIDTAHSENLAKSFGVSVAELPGALSRIEAIVESARQASLPGSAEAKHRGESYSLAKVIRGLVHGGIEGCREHAPMEYEMHAELHTRKFGSPQAVSPDGQGGFLVPSQVRNDLLIDLYRPQVVALSMGVVELDFDASEVDIPTIVSTITPSEGVAENQGTPTTNMTVGMAKMTPHTSQVYIEMSKRFIESGPGVDALLNAMIAKELAIVDDRNIMKGVGGQHPIGIYTAAGHAVDFTGVMETSTTPDFPKYAFYEKLLEMEDALADASALFGKLGWIIPNKAYRAMRLIRGNSTTVSSVDHTADMDRRVFSAGQEMNVIGYPMKRSVQLAQGADTEMIFGNFLEVLFGRWGGLRLEASGVAGDALKKRQIHLVAYCDVDVLVKQPDAFAVSTNLDLSGM